ncbi:TetR/AcrR family transcriptional regulator [Gymnodinialimonas sp. 2305UL16-5]|uniref:TetR/AcrR family transcriptional regulator n=1 Tax=Gymnodinialimonas mytili TaxID=3126503 RepID=UPI00309E06FB
MEQDISALDRRTQIIETTTELFLDKGFSGTSMSAIATACGITKASLYHHFKGKDQLFSACVAYGYTAALEAMEEIVADDGISPKEKLSKAVKILYDITVESNAGRMSPLIAEVSSKFPTVARAFHTEYIEPQRALLWQIVEEGVRKGHFQPLDQNQFFHVAFGPMVMLSLAREMFATFDDLDEHFPVSELRDGHFKVLGQMLQMQID